MLLNVGHTSLELGFADVDDTCTSPLDSSWIGVAPEGGNNYSVQNQCFFVVVVLFYFNIGDQNYEFFPK